MEAVIADAAATEAAATTTDAAVEQIVLEAAVE